MTLGEKQRLFARLSSEFMVWAIGRGYEFTYGEARRSDEQAELNAMGADGRAELVQYLVPHYPVLAKCIANNVGSGIRLTLHEIGLALDLNLFRDGVYLTKTEDWREIGEHWEGMNPLCRWGGRWGDGNHISLEHEGRK